MPAAPQFQPLNLATPLTGAALAETLDGGQCFRWRRGTDGTWHGVTAAVTADLREIDCKLQAYICAGTLDSLRHHLADDRDWRALADALPWRTDTHIANAIDGFPGLRVLCQPIGEALLCFLCSATKQIVQIKQMVALLAQRFGPPLAPGINALPSWTALADVPESALRECLLGFRAKHISAAARVIASHPGWLEETAALPYPRAHERLLTLPGVGAKIADCVLLFGAGMLEAFPVDTWILRAMERRYRLTGWKPDQIAHFGRTHFGPLAGLAQQYLFAHERALARSVPVARLQMPDLADPTSNGGCGPSPRDLPSTRSVK